MRERCSASRRLCARPWVPNPDSKPDPDLNPKQWTCPAGQEDRDPYWTRPWPSAVALAAALLERPELVAGKSIADVGAGLGLAGIAAALAGACAWSREGQG